ncbi:MAG: hypothetical protein HY000_09630 [Planctomycetes bacterium]|nr:hypothetical protein [Planctomycetota bacterium]
MTADLDTRLDRLERMLAQLLERGNPLPRFLTLQAAADFCSLSAKSVRRLLESGALSALRPRAGRVLIDRTELEGLILASANKRFRQGRGRRTA